MKRTISILALALAVGVVASPMTASAQGMYEVKITNVTPGQVFAPILAVTHSPDMSIFMPGTQASAELRMMAEVGDISGLMMMYEGMKGMGVMDVQSSGMGADGMIPPGVTKSIMISGMYGYRVSLVGMLVPTNDAFMGANLMLPGEGGMMSNANAYDAGTEMNDELCSSIPNPMGWPECDAMGMGEQIGMGEGGIVISNGINGQGDFMPMMRDWKNPVARITVHMMQ